MIKRFIGFLVVLGIFIGLNTTMIEASSAGTRYYENQGFTELSISAGMKLDVKQAEKYTVEIRTRENLFKQIRVEQYGKKLEFSMLPFTFPTAPIEIFITMPALTGIDLSGGSTVEIMMDQPETDFSISLSGGSELKGILQTKRLELDLSGGSQSILTGKAELVEIDASGSSRIQHESFPVNQAHIDLSGGSKAYVFVKELIVADASGGAQVYYRGTPKLKTSFSGGSGIHCLE